MSQKHILNPLDTVARGENPNGFVAQTCNETVRAGNSEVGSEYKFGQNADGERWNARFTPAETVPIEDARQKRRRPDR